MGVVAGSDYGDCRWTSSAGTGMRWSMGDIAEMLYAGDLHIGGEQSKRGDRWEGKLHVESKQRETYHP